MPRIDELLRRGPTFSFELSAPRTPEAKVQLDTALARLAPLRPDFMSVTYGAGGTTRGPTAEVVRHIQHDLGVTAMPHLTCVAHTRPEIVELIDGYAHDGVENLLALRGDLPREDGRPPCRDFARAIDLIELVRSRHDLSLGVAAHPEGHPLATSREADREHQAAKLRVADFAITQFFYRTEYYLEFVEEMRRRGVTTPVIPGVMPPSNLAAVSRMSALNGTELPDEIRTRLEAAGEDRAARREVAVEVAVRLCRELLSAGAPGLHVYTLNFAAIPVRVVEELRQSGSTR